MLYTWPDLAAALNILSRYRAKIIPGLWKSLERVLAYLKGIIDIKLIFKKNAIFESTISWL